MFFTWPADVSRITLRTLGPQSSVTMVIIIYHSFLIVFVNDSLMTHLGSIFTGYPKLRLFMNSIV